MSSRELPANLPHPKLYQWQACADCGQPTPGYLGPLCASCASHHGELFPRWFTNMTDAQVRMCGLTGDARRRAPEPR